MKILILGHNGMLGHVVFKFFKNLGFDVHTINSKFPDKSFCDEIMISDCDFLINCIGCIPQKHTSESSMMISNFFLPVFLTHNFGGKIIHATTDCEFSGLSNSFYSKESFRDAVDFYGKSKILASNYMLNYAKCHIIRTSIIGFELNSRKSLLEWFLNNKISEIKGFSDHWWNGITTLQWAKIAHQIVENQISDNFIQVGTEAISKFDLLNIFNEIFQTNHNITKQDTGCGIFKCLISDFKVPNIQQQIIELKNWYK